MQAKVFAFLAVVCLFHFQSSAWAGSVLRLSDFSSDQTAASHLLAELDFTVTGGSLSLRVANETTSPFAFDIDAIYFNAGPHITGLSLDGVAASAGWVIALNERADGFGVFDFALMTGLGNDPAEIGSGDSAEFSFSIAGTGPFLSTDFTTEFSTVPPGNLPALAVIKFINGPGDDSAFGGTIIPEPATLVLLLSGIALAARRRTAKAISLRS